MANQTTLRTAIEAAKNALHRISLASQNSMSSKEECGRIARETIPTLTAALAQSDAGEVGAIALATADCLKAEVTCLDKGFTDIAHFRRNVLSQADRLIAAVEEATPADTPLADPPNLRLFTADGLFYLYGMDASGSGPTPQAAMRDWTRHRNTEAAETWPIEPADTPPPSPQPSREEWIALEAACDDSRRQRNQDAAEFWLALAAKCRAHAWPETGEK